MRNLSLRVLALLMMFGFAIIFVGMRDFGGGIDGGTHYAIADQLSQWSGWPLPASSIVGWISHYPPAAHFLAARVGDLSGSTLHGLFIITAISLVVFYLVVADLLKAESASGTVGRLVVFVALAIAFRKFRFVVGNEMIDHFFFAHLAGNAALMAGFYIAYRTVRLPFWRWLAFCAVTTHLVGWFFPLSAIELALAASILRGAPMESLRQRLKPRAIQTATSAIVFSAIAVVHPTMSNMVAISTNNGGIAISTDVILTIVFGALILTPLFLYYFSGTGSVRSGALFALSIGALVPCVTLGALYMIDKGGSLYAVKKSGFLLGTVTCMILSVLLIQLVTDIFAAVAKGLGAKFNRSETIARPFEFPRLDTTVTSCAFVVIMIICVFASRQSIPVSLLTSYDRDVRQLLSQGSPDQFYGTTVSINSALSAHVNFTVGNPVLRQTVAAIPQHELFLSKTPSLANAQYVIVNAAEALRYEKECIMRSSEKLAIVTSDCFSAKLQQSPDRKPVREQQ